MIWKYLVRPLLFLLPAETAHYFTLNGLKWICKIPGVKNLLHWIFNSGLADKPVNAFGLRFKNAVGLAAGLDKDGRYIEELSLLGFSHIEIGTVTPRPQGGNPKPRLFRLPKDMALINRMGFNNLGADQMSRTLRQLNKPKDLILGINIGKNKDTPLEKAEEDYLYCFEALYPYADYFAINISSPNTPGLRGLQAKEPLIRLLNVITTANSKKSNPKPVLVKLAPDLDDQQMEEARTILLEYKVDGIIMGNTTLDRGGLLTNQERLNTIGAGGLSGLPLTEKSMQKLKPLIHASEPLPVIGVGGIMDVSTAIDMLEAGACLIQVYTGFIYEGPFLVRKICKAISG